MKTENIAVVIREMPFLKILTPVMLELHNHGVKYNLYFLDNYKGDKEYARPTIQRIKDSCPKLIEYANKVKGVSSDAQLLTQLIKDRITKLISLEIWLWAKRYLKELKRYNIRTYNILYLSDSLWQSDKTALSMIDKTYYSTKYLMQTQHSFLGMSIDDKKAMFLGSPIFDPIVNEPSKGKDILVLMPNIRKDNIAAALGGDRNKLTRIVEKLSHAGDLIVKVRKKQWYPGEIKKYAKEIIDDGKEMYPPVMSELLKRTYFSVMFFSSGIYECVYGGNRVLNIELPLTRWNWDQSKMNRYFSLNDGSLYQFDGVVESISQSTVLSPEWKLNPRPIETKSRLEWMDKFIGVNPAAGTKAIVNDILEN